MVQRALDIIAYFRPKFWFMENPWSGMLRHRPVVAHLAPPKKTSYCKFGYPYQKHTAIWTNADELELPVCNKDCAHMALSPTGRWKHPSMAQKFGERRGDIVVNKYPLNQLYSMPAGLCCQICRHVGERLESPEPEPAEPEPAKGDVGKDLP